MYDECVVAAYDTVDQARLAVHVLNRADFPTAQVSLVTKRLEDEGDMEAELNYGDDSLRDAFVGAGLGGVFGMLGGASVVSLLGGGVALLAGPLAGLATGAVVVRCSEGWAVGASIIRICPTMKNWSTRDIHW